MRWDRKIISWLFVIGYLCLLVFVCKVENVFGISQLPWHIDVALVGSVYMLVGYYLRTYFDGILSLKLRSRILLIAIFAVSATVFIMCNSRVIMVSNQYGNMLLFFAGAIMMTFSILLLFNIIGSIKCPTISVLSFWGRNTPMFIGFNYLFNFVLRQIFKVVGLEESLLFCVVDVVVVMIGCSVIAVIWNSTFCRHIFFRKI